MIIDLTTGLTYETVVEVPTDNKYWDNTKLAEEQVVDNYIYVVNHLTSFNYTNKVYETIEGVERHKSTIWNEVLPSNSIVYDMIRVYYSDISTEKTFNTIEKFELNITIQQ